MFDFLNTDPIAFTIPIGAGLDIYWYGIIVTIGIGLGIWWAGREIEKRGENVDDLYNGALIVVIAGFIFARFWYVFQDAILDGNSVNYPTFLSVINIRNGGVNILGGFVGAFIVGVIWLYRKKLKPWPFMDAAGPALLIAQAIGRWGNLINQELYGPPTGSDSWGLLIDAPNRIAPYNDLATYPAETRFHPTFFYESMWLLVGFIVLSVLNNRNRDKWRQGTLFGLFLIWWGVGRTWIEFFRPDQPGFEGSTITFSMIFAVAIALAGIIWLLHLYEKITLPGVRRRRSRLDRIRARNRQIN
ncbi:MAG: prolipoprotein diacylglyceryl transferase [Chloroflexi bacterium]|nr:prolipoprotein diacylglyceryl transferase [Chloroflexota bacterium]MBP8055940.1 prolipoprotein diacylglyceryl transferase [Chloroflexota bacterium]